LQGTGLEDDLSGEGPFTFLAPTDSALYKLEEQGLKNLMEDKHFAAQVLRQHLLPGSKPPLQHMLSPYLNNT
jgi:uncharacterized surface protein with fasciclin (FAS1) repeats